MAIDAQAATVFAVSDASVLYRIDPTTGAATAIGDGINSPVTDPGIGFEIRLRSNGARIAVAIGENLAVDLATGTVGIDPAAEEPGADAPFTQLEATAAPRIVALALLVGPTDAQELYGIDSLAGTLVLIPSPTDGVVQTVGPLGITVTDGASFDIGPNGEALLVVPG